MAGNGFQDRMTRGSGFTGIDENASFLNLSKIFSGREIIGDAGRRLLYRSNL
jgi:hypothetical protein